MKFIFFKPKRKKYLIFDRAGSKILKTCILKKNIHTLDVRYESINIYILIYTFFKNFFFFFRKWRIYKKFKKILYN